MNVLVIAPHPDDEAIGCGGSIRLHVEQGDRVGVVFLTSGELGIKSLAPDETIAVREAEAVAASRILGNEIVAFFRLPDYDLASSAEIATSRLAALLEQWQPAQIYIPHPHESHPDHAACDPILRDALKRSQQSTAWILGYEVWTPMREFDTVQDISHVWTTKRSAINAYVSQLATFAYDRAAEGLGQYRGALAGHCHQAEVQITLG